MRDISATLFMVFLVATSINTKTAQEGLIWNP